MTDGNVKLDIENATEEQKAGFAYHQALFEDLKELCGKWQEEYELGTQGVAIEYGKLYRKFVLAIIEMACVLAIDSGMDEATFIDTTQKMYKARLAIAPRFS